MESNIILTNNFYEIGPWINLNLAGGENTNEIKTKETSMEQHH